MMEMNGRQENAEVEKNEESKVDLRRGCLFKTSS